jgi:hypothetical protein
MGRLTVKKSGEPKNVSDASNCDDQIDAYSQALPLPFRAICERLRELIDAALPRAASKIWHGSPVWFIDDNPVVGYSTTARTVNLLFWNGQAFDEPGLEPVGKHRAARAAFSDGTEIDPKLMRRWLNKAELDVFDSKAYFKTLRNQER